MPLPDAEAVLGLGADVPVCLGGTFFELAHVKNRVNEYCAFATDLGIGMLEVSDGSIEMEKGEKLRYIETLAKDFRVLSEYGYVVSGF